MAAWGYPGRSWTLEFHILGIPVRVHPAFWLIALLLGLNNPNPITLLAWVLAVFVGVLIHELGHALMMRKYGYRPEILLYGLGGLTEFGGGWASGASTRWSRISISAAGPLAGVASAVAVAALVSAFGGKVQVVLLLRFIPIPVIVEPVGSVALTTFLQYLIWIGIFWSLINLMPVFPLDGGQIARELLLAANPRDGLHQSLALSFYTAIFLAAFGYFALDSILMLILFGVLAYNNYQMLRGGGCW